ncbi:hypothetical protein HD554DRAFT_2028678, partial [Boletus coccyginus]
LPDLIREYQTQYSMLSDANKESLIKEFTAFKKSKLVELQITAWSRVNDVMYTLREVENECFYFYLHKLQYHTGTKTILYSVHGSTDLPLCGVIFATRNVENLMESVMHVDPQNLISKMEGFAVQGIQDTVHFSSLCISTIHAKICKIINIKLREIMKEPSAKMQWLYYFRNIVQSYKVIIVGWPQECIPFANLSSISNSLTDLEMFLQK